MISPPNTKDPISCKGVGGGERLIYYILLHYIHGMYRYITSPFVLEITSGSLGGCSLMPLEESLRISSWS